jgi:crossover junction endodeoxyribonuclease RuvC
MRSMGIDISTKTGVAVVESGRKLIHASQIEFPKLSGWERAGNIAEAVREVYFKSKPDIVVIEDYAEGRHGNTSSFVVVAEVTTLVRFSLYMEDVVPLYVKPSALKKFVTGKGTGDKAQVLMHVFKRWGIAPSTDNVGDAVGLAMFGLCALGEPSTQADLSVVAGTLDKSAGVLSAFSGKTTVQLTALR